LEPGLDKKEDKTDVDIVPRHAENLVGDMNPAKDDVQLNLAKGCEELESRLCMMDSKLREVRAPEFRLSIMNVSFLVHVPVIVQHKLILKMLAAKISELMKFQNFKLSNISFY
jgi:hypothetical protein